MEKTYNYTKRYLESQINTLSQPVGISLKLALLLTDDKSQLTTKQLTAILNRSNQIIAINQKLKFNKQAVDVVSEQIYYNELEEVKQSKLRLLRSSSSIILEPICLFNRDYTLSGDTNTELQSLRRSVEDLPEGRYLFVRNKRIVDSVEFDNIVNDRMDSVVSHMAGETSHHEEYQETDDADGLVQTYDRLKSLLIQKLNQLLSLKLKQDKLKQLQGQLARMLEPEEGTTASVSGIQSNLITNANLIHDEIVKVKILLERTGYKLAGMEDAEFQEIMHKINSK
ncbi:hypothetical protein BABINDRAFT_162938 [Babjeviella inositovora NRRL Y-12698]|uniref:Uncharacterized protein n=1 Tax=Babjeviella inositovora NRRL Y-12698 TaxID=984486 RepID=A0A1E3QMR1_9ASCO|nr:uncharacterized protein BABINDRAFT_162938 [Babjeviella inositovora NRRL Y-12698]ODQ78287.1 hypothetical protein BABINDRAFT_162938 [Babjeviella inositovora NRRL Y-12698]